MTFTNGGERGSLNVRGGTGTDSTRLADARRRRLRR